MTNEPTGPRTPSAEPEGAEDGEATTSMGLRRGLSAVLLLLVILCVVSEVGLRVLFRFDPVLDLVSGYDAPSSRLQWVRARQRGESFVYSFDVWDARRGWGVQPDLRDLPVFDGKLLSSNSVGLRGVDEYSLEPEPGIRRIAVFGDSFTFGDEVSDHETWAHLLDERSDSVEVLNFGVHGYGIDQALVYLQDDGVRYQPDYVVLGFVWFDIQRNLFTFNNFAKPRYRDTDQGLVLENVPVPSPDEVLAAEPFRLKTLDLVGMVWERLRWVTGVNDRRAERLGASVLDDFVRTAREAGARPVISYLPVLAESIDTTSAPTENEAFLRSWCASRDVPCHFFRQRYAEQALELGLMDLTRHWSPPGHVIVAEEIGAFIDSLAAASVPDGSGSLP